MGLLVKVSIPTIVVAEDDRAIGELVANHLTREGYFVRLVADGRTALQAARASADLVLLDVGLPGLDGFEVARTLRRERRSLPIIMLTARTEEIDRIIGFELGADDYVCKPFSPRELVARVRAVVRRSCGALEPISPTLHLDRLVLYRETREVRVDGDVISLRPREYRLFAELAENAGIPLSREHLIERVWGADYLGEDRTVDVHIRRLRMRLEGDCKLGRLIETVRGFGYKLVKR